MVRPGTPRARVRRRVLGEADGEPGGGRALHRGWRRAVVALRHRHPRAHRGPADRGAEDEENRSRADRDRHAWRDRRPPLHPACSAHDTRHPVSHVRLRRLTAPPSAPTTKPTGPVIRIPSRGPRLASGVTTRGPTKPTPSPAVPTIHPARQLASRRARVPGSRPPRAAHHQRKPIVTSHSVMGTRNTQPSRVGSDRLRSVTQPAMPSRAVPAAAEPRRRAGPSVGGALVIAGSVLDRQAIVRLWCSRLSYTPEPPAI